MTLAWLKQLANKLGIPKRIDEVAKEDYEGISTPYGSYGSNFSSPRYDEQENTCTRSPLPTYSPYTPSPSGLERKTSLGVSCQKFLMLFLVSTDVS